MAANRPTRRKLIGTPKEISDLLCEEFNILTAEHNLRQWLNNLVSDQLSGFGWGNIREMQIVESELDRRQTSRATSPSVENVACNVFATSKTH